MPEHAAGVDHDAEARRVDHAEADEGEGAREGGEPEGEAGDDAEVRLAEEAVEGGADAPAEDGGGARAGEAIVAGVDDLAGREHHLEGARVGGAVAEGPGAVAALDRVADDAPVRAAAGGAREEARSARAEEGVEVGERHAGLDGDVGERLVEVDDAVHAAEVEEDGAVARGDARSEAPVLAAAHRVDGHPEAVGDAQAGLHLVARGGADDGGGARAGGEGGRVRGGEGGGIGDHVLGAHGVCEGGERVVEVHAGDPAGCSENSAGAV